MSDEDEHKWNTKYAHTEPPPSKPSSILAQLGDLLPMQGEALDVAGGAGRHSIWLAQRGLNVTLSDISAVGLEIAEKRAESLGVSLSTVRCDVDRDPLPPGPWDLVICVQFLHRPLFQVFPEIMRPNGILLVLHPTRSNLQRHKKPPVKYLMEDGELPTLVGDLEIVHYEEGWLIEDRHDAIAVARRSRC